MSKGKPQNPQTLISHEQSWFHSSQYLILVVWTLSLNISCMEEAKCFHRSATDFWLDHVETLHNTKQTGLCKIFLWVVKMKCVKEVWFWLDCIVNVHFLLPVVDLTCHTTSCFPFCVCLCFCLLVLEYSIFQILSVVGSCLEQDCSQQLELIIVFFLRSFGNVRLPASPKVCYFFWKLHVPSPFLLESFFYFVLSIFLYS